MSPARVDVALDARLTSHMSLGMRQYAAELVRRLPEVAPDLRFATFGAGDNFDLAEQLAAPLWIARRRPRLVHFLSPYAPVAIPAPYVLTIHDLIDLRFPAFTKPKAVWYYRTAVRRAARNAEAVVTDDESTAGDIEAFFGVSAERIAVIPLGVDLDPSEPVKAARPYVIYAGNRRAHKDLPTLLAAWRSVDATFELDLVMSGEIDPQLSAHRPSGRLRFLGPSAHAALMGWIAGAAALVHPALAEGFGLPLLEAMRLGTPVIAAEPSVPRLLRAHATMFAAGDAASLARAIEAALRGELRELAARARLATAGLTWDRCARATAELYRRLLAR